MRPGELLDVINQTILEAASGWWTLVGLFVLCVVDGFFPVVPSDSLVVGLGSLSGEPGTPFLLWVILVAAAGALLGDFIAYRIGRAIGPMRFGWMRRPAPQRTLVWARHELDKRGVLLIFVGRFIPGARVAINFVAGTTGFSLRRFLIIDAIASLVWASYSVGIGAISANIFDSVLVAMTVSITGAVLLGWIFDRIFRLVTRWLDRKGVHLDPEGYFDTAALPVEPPLRLHRDRDHDSHHDGTKTGDATGVMTWTVMPTVMPTRSTPATELPREDPRATSVPVLDRLGGMTSTSAEARSAAAKLEEQLRNLPKVSLHDHLDGSLRPSTLIELAAEIGHELPSQDSEELAERFRQNANSGSLEQYLEAFAHTTAVMQTAPNLRRVAKEYVEDLAADGIIYSEVRWAPEQHQGQGLSLDEAVEAVQEGLNQGMETVAEQDGLIVVGQLVSAMRQSDRADEIVEVALRHRDKGVVGFDIAGPEAGFPPSRFADAFTRLATEMLPTTVHAGEGDGIESVRDALVSGRAQRLGHGVRVAEDISVIEGEADSEAGEEVFQVELGPVARWVRDRQIHLEVSPTSNLQTGAIAGFAQDQPTELSDHPFDMLYQLGFNVGVNTDNRLVSGVTLSGELALIASTFDYGLGELADFQINALESSFLGHEEREALAGMILEAWQ